LLLLFAEKFPELCMWRITYGNTIIIEQIMSQRNLNRSLSIATIVNMHARDSEEKNLVILTNVR